MRNPRGLLLAFSSLLWCLFSGTLARAQPCVTCRTEACVKNTWITPWCGTGPNPQLGGEQDRPTGAGGVVSGVSIESSPPGAEVRLDGPEGQRLGKTPIRGAKLKAGPHTLCFVRDGYLSRRVEVSVSRRNETFVAQMVQAGALRVSSRPTGASVYLDGVRVGTTPRELNQVAPGAHVVELQAEGLAPKREPVEVMPGAVAAISVSLDRPSAAATEIPPPPAQAPCPTGQLATADTQGHCCWPGQAWSGEQCLGIPTSCPKGFITDRSAQRCAPPACATGMLRTPDAVHCCWPAQIWAPGREQCVGVPACPSGYVQPPDHAGAERCVREPTLDRVSFNDGQCGGATPSAVVCNLKEYSTPGRADLTTEEIGELRARWRASGLDLCRRAAAARACRDGREIDGQRYYCCP